MQKTIIIVLGLLILAIGFQQYFRTIPEAVAPTAPVESTSSAQSLSSQDVTEAEASGSVTVKSIPTAESIRDLADQYENRVEKDEEEDSEQ